MRRFMSVPLAAILCLVAVSAASAAPPTHERTVAPPIEFAAGEMCDFPLLVETTFENSKSTTFAVRDDGSQRILTRGVATGVATNLDTGETLDQVGGYRISIVIAADGSVEADGTGVLYAYYFAGDPATLGPGFHAINGHVHESYAADGTLIGSTFRGKALDLCEALA